MYTNLWRCDVVGAWHPSPPQSVGSTTCSISFFFLSSSLAFNRRVWALNSTLWATRCSAPYSAQQHSCQYAMRVGLTFIPCYSTRNPMYLASGTLAALQCTDRACTRTARLCSQLRTALFARFRTGTWVRSTSSGPRRLLASGLGLFMLG